MNDYAIEAKQITKSYGPVLALDQVNLHIRTGSIYGLIGDNGAGKSTFLKLLAGHIFPTAGELRLFGQFAEQELRRCRRQMGAMIEQPGFFPNLTVEDTLEYYRIQRGIPGREKVEEVLKLTDIQEKRRAKCKKLSMGQKQRLGLAIAMIGEPRLLVLDEPINGLDPIGIAEVRSFIRNLCDSRGKTILISSHILSEIALLADDIGIIDHGVLLEEESLVKLEQKSSRYIHFTVSDTAQAARILERRFGEHQFTIQNDRDLQLHNLNLQVGEVVTAFVKNGLVVSEAHTCEESLEDYFKRVTGGEGIA